MENILNIVNFIRGVEPRDPSCDLLAPVREQIRLMQENHLPGTFLVQYDAMEREDILALLRPLDPEQFELGIWLEMNRPHCEAAGLPWRGREGYDWDYHAHCGFSVGYTREEREKLVDAIMEKFEQTFHRKAYSVGSWMIDAYTLQYLSDKYQIVASCNCKDQWGTDGYTIWGGYWNQGYYPSRNNVLCPAQTESEQIPVPVFRMLGSDPVTQYDLGLNLTYGASECQMVASLEPVYREGGGCPQWVDWFMRQNFTGGSLAFAYAQAGQENSFGWPAMKDGLEYQFPLFARWRAENGLRVERMEDTGRWYRQQFAITPATAVCALEPYQEARRSVWYNCRNYRANLFLDENGLRFRDITLFDQSVRERYLDAVCETEYLVYENLPIVDGNRMSGRSVLAGAYLLGENGERITCDGLQAEEQGDTLLLCGGGCRVQLTESGIEITGAHGLQLCWQREKTSFVRIDGDRLCYSHNGVPYALQVTCGRIRDGEMPLLLAEGGRLSLAFARAGEMETSVSR